MKKTCSAFRGDKMLFQKKKKTAQQYEYNPTQSVFILFHNRFEKYFKLGETFMSNKYGYGFVINARVNKIFLTRKIDDINVIKMIILALNNLSQYNVVMFFDVNLTENAIQTVLKMKRKIKKLNVLEHITENCGNRPTCVVTDAQVLNSFNYNEIVTQLADGTEAINSRILIYSVTNLLTKHNYTVVFSGKRFIMDYAYSFNVQPIRFLEK